VSAVRLWIEVGVPEGDPEDGGVVTPYLSDPDVTLCACGCETPIQNPDVRGRPRKFARGHNLRVDHPLHRPGVENWWKGRKHTAEVRARLSETAKRPKPWLRGKRNGMSGRTGASNPNWKGGVTPERQALYASAEWREVVRAVKRRDGGGCVECGSARGLHVHHVRSFAAYPELRLDPANLVTLCRVHHHDVHRKEVTP
jgi:hypothetical protein